MEIAPSYPELGEAGYGICRMRDLAWVIDRKQSRSSKELLPNRTRRLSQTRMARIARRCSMERGLNNTKRSQSGLQERLR